MREKYFFWIFVKNVSSEAKKPVVGVRQTSNFAQTQIMPCLKKHAKITFLPEQHNMVKMESEKKYLLNFFIVKNIWCAYLRLVFNLSPQFYLSCLQNAWITTDLLAIFTAAVDYGQLVPKYKSKVNLSSWRSPNISVWNNYILKKWEPW